MKKIAVLPTLLTLGNAVCGFAAIACASKITENTQYFFAWSGWFIFAAMLFDSLDGYVARLARSTSKFGCELDSLCDAISFGLAPAFLLMRMGPPWESQLFLHQFLAGIAALYMICALLRLARYNVEALAEPASSSKRFRGLPSPAAAGCLASLAILRGELDKWNSVDVEMLRHGIEIWSTLGALVVALLMVSRVPYPHLTKQILNQSLRGRRSFGALVQFIFMVFVIVVTRELSLLLVFWVYALAMPARYALLRAVRPDALPAPATSSMDDGTPR